MLRYQKFLHCWEDSLTVWCWRCQQWEARNSKSWNTRTTQSKNKPIKLLYMENAWDSIVFKGWIVLTWNGNETSLVDFWGAICSLMFDSFIKTLCVCEFGVCMLWIVSCDDTKNYFEETRRQTMQADLLFFLLSCERVIIFLKFRCLIL